MITDNIDKSHDIPNKLLITDTTLRDAHQSLWATRMRTSDIMGIIDTIDNVGYYSLEVWGGATFDACMRFLRENPWERLRLIKSKAKKTPLQMLLRGQNLVGYKNYADDVVDRFIALSCDNGMDIFRVFDALNDTRNLESSIRSVKKYGGHAQGTICYTISPVHSVDKFVQYAKEQVQLGIDSIVIKDMAGILAPSPAQNLVSALKKEVSIPIQIHSHATSGMACATYMAGVLSGAEAIDCAISSMSGFSSQPAVETMAAIMRGTNIELSLDMDALDEIAKYFATLEPNRRLATSMTSAIDADVLTHQIPGGMISNFKSQLEAQDAMNKLPEALAEVSKVRAELGYPPLVTPLSQMIGTQAAMNVLRGKRYEMVPNEVKDYLRGYYGRAPGEIDKDFIKSIVGKEKVITHRPADLLEPMLEEAATNLDPDLIEEEEDIISFAIFGDVAVDFYKWRKLHPSQRPRIPADVELDKVERRRYRREPSREELLRLQKKNGLYSEQLIHAEDVTSFQKLFDVASKMNLSEITVSKGDFNLSVRANGHGSSTVEGSDTDLRVRGNESVKRNTQDNSGTKEKHRNSTPAKIPSSINAPISGTFYAGARAGDPPFVSVGDIVDKNAKVCTVEAMKLYNEVVAPFKCKILSFLVKDGEQVKQGDVLIVVKKV